MECHEGGTNRSSNRRNEEYVRLVAVSVLIITALSHILQRHRPPPFSQLLGINVFTYILAAAIAFFLSMNLIFGQGWLGNILGIKGTGTFVERSENLPNVVDLGDSQFSI